jgi:ABC-type multidrug transport system fused ATPase/permease subunit
MKKSSNNEELQKTFNEIAKLINLTELYSLKRMQIVALKSQQALFKLSLQELPEQRKAFLFALVFGFVAAMSAGIGLFVVGVTLANLMIMIGSVVVEIAAFVGFIYLLNTYRRARTEKKVVVDEVKATDASLHGLDDMMNEMEQDYIKAKQETQELLEKARRQLKPKPKLPEKETQVGV